MTPNPMSNGTNPAFSDVLKNLPFEKPDQIAKPETGLRIAQRIYDTQVSDSPSLNFFKSRSERWHELVKWAMGKQSNKEFLQYFAISDANKALFPMDMSPTMVGAWLVNTLVTDMSKNEEYPCVTAIDDGSVTEKEQRKLDALFRMRNAKEINQMEEAAGMMFEPPDAYVPENELAAEVFFKLEDRLPKEIEYEQKLEAALHRNQYQNVLSPKIYFDLIVNNTAATKLEADHKGGYNIRKCIPQNLIYNYFMGDTGRLELAYIGEVYSLKVSEIRRKYPSITEKELFELAKTSTQQNIGTTFNFHWEQQHEIYNDKCPWDDYSVPVFDFEIHLETVDYFVSRTDRFGKENIKPKDKEPVNTSGKSVIKKKKKSRWHRGVYAPFAKKMLYWGMPDIVLFPFLHTECGLSSYSIVIPFNQGEYVPSLFERAMEPLKEYTLTKLKRKQLISQLKPKGIRIDVESARNIDLGNGDSIPWKEVLRIYNQTGTEVYSSRGVDPTQREAPAISQGVNDSTIQDIIQLTQVANGHLMEIRTLVGLPTYRDGGEVGDRTANALAERQASASYNVTDFIPTAKAQLMSETLYKCCLLEWQKAVKNGDSSIQSTEFDVEAKMKPTQYEKQLLAQRIDIWSKTPDKWGNPLLSPKDVYYIENIKDFKLAQLYLANIIETNRKRAMEESAALDKMNSENQVASAEAAAQKAKELEDMKTQAAVVLDEAKAKNEMNKLLLSGIFDLVKAGAPIPTAFEPLIDMVVKNIAIPLAMENAQQEKQLQQFEQAEQQEQQEMAQINQIAQENGMTPDEVMQQMAAQQEQEQMVA